MLIYLDESGNLIKSNEKFFIVGSFTVGDSKRIANAFRKWQRQKFPKKLKVQVADWICGALARYHEQKPKGKEFYNILKNNIVKQKELFSDYWSKR